MSSYKINFEQISQDKALSEMLHALQRGLAKFSIDYYLVGAVSRNVWMSGLNNIPPRRTTGDIDFAVLINDKGLYEQLKDYLVSHESFTPYQQNAFVLIYKNGIEVDLLPFGAVEDENRKVTVAGTGYTSIHVDGFREVYDQQLPEVDLEGHLFKFCSLPGIVLLKLIAWDDRPEARTDDIKDICDILSHFFTMYQETIWEKHNDLFTEENRSLLEIAARVLGREIAVITRKTDALHNRIRRILTNNTTNSSSTPITFLMRDYFDNTVEECIRLIAEINQGMQETATTDY